MEARKFTSRDKISAYCNTFHKRCWREFIEYLCSSMAWVPLDALPARREKDGRNYKSIARNVRYGIMSNKTCSERDFSAVLEEDGWKFCDKLLMCDWSRMIGQVAHVAVRVRQLVFVSTYCMTHVSDATKGPVPALRWRCRLILHGVT